MLDNYKKSVKPYLQMTDCQYGSLENLHKVPNSFTPTRLSDLRDTKMKIVFLLTLCLLTFVFGRSISDLNKLCVCCEKLHGESNIRAIRKVQKNCRHISPVCATLNLRHVLVRRVNKVWKRFDYIWSVSTDNKTVLCLWSLFLVKARRGNLSSLEGLEQYRTWYNAPPRLNKHHINQQKAACLRSFKTDNRIENLLPFTLPEANKLYLIKYLSLDNV